MPPLVCGGGWWPLPTLSVHSSCLEGIAAEDVGILIGSVHLPRSLLALDVRLQKNLQRGTRAFFNSIFIYSQSKPPQIRVEGSIKTRPNCVFKFQLMLLWTESESKSGAGGWGGVGVATVDGKRTPSLVKNCEISSPSLQTESHAILLVAFRT